MKTSRVELRLSPEAADMLQTSAQAKGLTKSELVRTAVAMTSDVPMEGVEALRVLARLSGVSIGFLVNLALNKWMAKELSEMQQS